ncbi:MAG: hypothetical protein ACREFQ_10285 [Stellaceae bacterium]
MSVAENIEPLPRAGSYQLARFNAIRHGVLSRHTVLPWEDGEEYRALIEALVAEHKPQGPTEEHLVEELAGVIWRKRRLRMAESAIHHRALKGACGLYRETAEAALIHVADPGKSESVADAIRATEAETADDFSDLESHRAMTENAIGLLDSPSAEAYSRALAALREDTREWWAEQLTWKRGDYEADEEPFRSKAEDLLRFLQEKVLPWFEERQTELDHRPLIRDQAFGEAVDPDKLERLARYETCLDRKLERMLAMLLRLQDLRRSAAPG